MFLRYGRQGCVALCACWYGWLDMCGREGSRRGREQVAGSRGPGGQGPLPAACCHQLTRPPCPDALSPPCVPSALGVVANLLTTFSLRAVTFVAIGNGAPDLSANITAIRGGDVLLSAGALTGGAGQVGQVGPAGVECGGGVRVPAALACSMACTVAVSKRCCGCNGVLALRARCSQARILVTSHLDRKPWPVANVCHTVPDLLVCL